MHKLFSFKDFTKYKSNLPEVFIPKESRGTILTKSRFMIGLKCDLLLWNQYHSENTLYYSPKNESNLHRMNIQNNSVLIYARSLFPEGEEVPKNLNMYQSHKRTMELTVERKVIYNACFLNTEYFSKTDILVPSREDDSWDIFEVKSSINIKRDHVKDLSFQLYVATKCGLKIKNCYLININPDYLFEETLDLEKFFIKVPLLERIKSAQPEFLSQLEYYKSLIYSSTAPKISSKYSCSTPKNCSLKTCFEDIGDGDIFSLREGGELVSKLYKSGIHYLKDIPDNTELSLSQKIQIDSEKSQAPFIQLDKLKQFMNGLSYPLYFLDFETINPALPIYFKTKPYQHIPFLYSLHVQENIDSPLEHFDYIDTNKEDPRKKILEDLSVLIKSNGTIICYNDTFEKRCLSESIQLYPEYEEWFSSIVGNFKDLSDPFKYFYYYHPLQKGSASLKSVLPALTGLNYKELGINDGNMANLEFLKAKTMNLSQEEIHSIQTFLLDYCKMDTFAMYKIVEALKVLVN